MERLILFAIVGSKLGETGIFFPAVTTGKLLTVFGYKTNITSKISLLLKNNSSHKQSGQKNIYDAYKVRQCKYVIWNDQTIISIFDSDDRV